MNQKREFAAARKLAEDEAQRAQEAEARADEQARVAARLRRRAMWLAGIAALAVMLAIAAGVFGLRSSPKANKAEDQARLALARQLAAQSLTQLDVNNDLAWLLAIEAGRGAENVETFGALRRLFAHPARTLAILSGHTDRVNHAVWNADGSRILTASNDGTARVWDAAGGTELAILTGHTDWVNQAVWSADGSRILTAGDDGTVFDAPRGRGPYGITTSPDGDVYFASLAGSYVGHINPTTGETTVLEPPTADQGARRVWSDSHGRIWVSEWNAGQVAVYDPAKGDWDEWKLPGSSPRAYAVYVDDGDRVWLSDFGGNAVVSFDPETQKFEVSDLPSSPGNVRQIHGRPGEIWLPESAADQIVVIRY